jgi:FeS assembly SUF system regulator
MLRITKEADYAVMLLGLLASKPSGHVHTAREAAAWSRLPLPMVSKILRGLARERVLASHRGAGGGYRLERAPADTSVAQVIRAVEGPIAMVQCGAEPGACERESYCPTRGHWTRISREVERALERIPITEMMPDPGAQARLLGVGERAAGRRKR